MRDLRVPTADADTGQVLWEPLRPRPPKRRWTVLGDTPAGIARLSMAGLASCPQRRAGDGCLGP
ncbi:hypothetical protein LX36DRAFT_664022 [Colletotrichum falcatum]|nr:hypothetical protein LX36DRAFT_664022 [Colletotrichum falcatum]